MKLLHHLLALTAAEVFDSLPIAARLVAAGAPVRWLRLELWTPDGLQHLAAAAPKVWKKFVFFWGVFLGGL